MNTTKENTPLHSELNPIRNSVLGDYEEATSSLLARLAHQSPPAPLSPPVPKPKERYWPAQLDARPLTSVTIRLRHPACTFALENIETRKIGRSPRSSPYGEQSRLPSMKMQRQMRANSSLEFDNLRDCELDPNVIEFVEQPAWLTYDLAGRRARHKGDTLVLTREGLEWQEVKYEREASLPDNEARWPEMGRALNSLGISFRVVTERHIRERVRLGTVEAIWENRLSPIPSAEDRTDILKAIESGAVKTISHLRSACAIEKPTVLALIRRGFLAIDLNKPISDQTEVRRGAGLRYAAGTRVRTS